MTIGQKLRIFGEEKFGSVSKLAEAIDMKPSSFYKYLNDETTPGGDILSKLLRLGCDLNWLLSQDDTSPPANHIFIYKIKQLEEENRLLRDNISHISSLTQAVIKSKKNRKRNN